MPAGERCSNDAVTTIDPDFGARHELGRVAGEEDDRSLQVLGITHLWGNVNQTVSKWIKVPRTLPIGVSASQVRFSS